MSRLKMVTVYRGIDCAPQDYQPTALAKSSACLPNRKDTPDDIWVHAELRGALSYATGLMNANLSGRKRGPFSKSVVLEFEIPNRQLEWEDNGDTRATFSRADIPDDRAIIKRVAVHGRNGRKQSATLEWFTKDEFFGATPSPTAS